MEAAGAALHNEFTATGHLYAYPALPLPNVAHRSGTYSITSSARRSIERGTVMPSGFAVFRLITSSNFVGCSTGRLTAFEDLIDVAACAAQQIDWIGAVNDQSATANCRKRYIAGR